MCDSIANEREINKRKIWDWKKKKHPIEENFVLSVLSQSYELINKVVSSHTLKDKVSLTLPKHKV